MKQYVIYLSSSSYRIVDDYGYWTGKNYIVGGELFPVTSDLLDETVKRYTSLKRAENALEKCLHRGYACVVGGHVEEV